MAVLPTQPKRGVSPGGIPAPPMEGQGRGPQLGAPRAQSPIPSSIPGVNTVPGEPDPDKIVELFSAYTTGQLSREQLINQLDVLSEGQGGILGLLQGMEDENNQDEAMGGASPGQMGMQAPTGAIPPMEGPLDKRHQRISALIQNYGVMPEDANQMATVLNPNEQGVPYAWEQEQVQLTFGDDPRTSTGIGTGSVTKQGAFDAARSSIAPSIKGLSDDQIWDVINTQAANAPMTNEDINVDFTPRSQVSRAQGGTMSEGGTSRWSTEEDEIIPPARPQETGVLVYDEETGQMVDSGTWMPPTGGYTTEAQRIAEAARIDRMQRAQGGSIGDMATGAENRAIQEGGGAYGDASAAADTVRATPAINGGAYGDMGTASTNRAIEAGGGAVGDMSAAADTVTQRNYPGAVGDAAWAAEHTPPVVPPAVQKESGRTGSGNMASIPLAAMGVIPGLKGIANKVFNEQGQDITGAIQNAIWPGWGDPGPGVDPSRDTKDPSERTGSGTFEDPYKDPRQPGAQNYGASPGGTPTSGVQSTVPGQVVNTTVEAEKALIAEESLFGKFGDDLFEGVDPRSYKGTDVTQTAEGVQVGKTEPFETGFKTVADFDFPEIKTFLNALTDEARTGMAGENLPGIIIDSLTSLTNAQQQGQVQLANANTNAAISFLDRAAAVKRDEARLKLEQGVELGEIDGELTLARKAEEYKKVMQAFLDTGYVPKIGPDGEFETRRIWHDANSESWKTGDKLGYRDEVVTSQSLERELTTAERQQQRDLQNTQMFGKLINMSKVVPGDKGVDSMETLEAQSFGFSKLLEMSEQSGYVMEYDPATPGKMKQMIDETTGKPVEVWSARRFALEKDLEGERQDLMARQTEVDLEIANLQTATVQLQNELSSLIDAGKLAEAIAVRKEKSINDSRSAEATKRQLTVNTLLALAKPATYVFAKRYNLLDDIGAALGIDFGQEAMFQQEVPPLITPGTYPTYDQLWNASPEEKQIMLAETAAYENMSVEGALQRIQDWRPGGTPLRRTAIKGATR